MTFQAALVAMAALECKWKSGFRGDIPIVERHAKGLLLHCCLLFLNVVPGNILLGPNFAIKRWETRNLHILSNVALDK